MVWVSEGDSGAAALKQIVWGGRQTLHRAVALWHGCINIGITYKLDS